jgi:hypothetical protein
MMNDSVSNWRTMFGAYHSFQRVVVHHDCNYQQR